MLGWTIPDHRGLGGLRLVELADPIAAAGDVVLHLHAAALNPADRYLAEGLYPARPTFPHVLGRDGSGTILAVGEGVRGWKPGDRALILRGDTGVTRPGTLAERVAVAADSLAPVPETYSDLEAAGAALVSLTAHQALLQWGRLAPSVVLVSGASGGVGVATVQLAAALGHTVIGLSRSVAKREQLLLLGATAVLDPRSDCWRRELKELLAPRRVDLVVDTIGGALFSELVDTLGFEGRVSVVGMLAGPVPAFNTASLFFRRVRIGGVAVGTDSRDSQAAAWGEVVSLLRITGSRPVVDSVFPLEEVPAAFARLAEGPMGKVIVRMTARAPEAGLHTVGFGGSS
ncbi:MAG: zinc-binding alcohol dehydrogenase family protein [Planctomycetota bacterium]|nr:MAG: zinc-binding alcohol dehydrogenase family protein [Planctomycetota bacterium]